MTINEKEQIDYKYVFFGTILTVLGFLSLFQIPELIGYVNSGDSDLATGGMIALGVTFIALPIGLYSLGVHFFHQRKINKKLIKQSEQKC